MSRRKLGVAKRRELEVAAAVAREAAMQFHVRAALALIELAGERVSAVRMLDIYMRLHGFSGAEAQLLGNSVLAALGERASSGAPAHLFVEGEDGAASSLLALVGSARGRLRGRTHHELRRQVELATGTAQAGLLDLHVRHALRFVRDLAETHSIGEATTLYADMAGVPAILREPLYIFVLDRLAAEELRGQSAAPPPAPPADPVALLPRTTSRPRRAV